MHSAWASRQNTRRGQRDGETPPSRQHQGHVTAGLWLGEGDRRDLFRQPNGRPRFGLQLLGSHPLRQLLQHQAVRLHIEDGKVCDDAVDNPEPRERQ